MIMNAVFCSSLLNHRIGIQSGLNSNPLRCGITGDLQHKIATKNLQKLLDAVMST